LECSGQFIEKVLILFVDEQKENIDIRQVVFILSFLNNSIIYKEKMKLLFDLTDMNNTGRVKISEFFNLLKVMFNKERTTTMKETITEN